MNYQIAKLKMVRYEIFAGFFRSIKPLCLEFPRNNAQNHYVSLSWLDSSQLRRSRSTSTVFSLIITQAKFRFNLCRWRRRSNSQKYKMVKQSQQRKGRRKIKRKWKRSLNSLIIQTLENSLLRLWLFRSSQTKKSISSK